MQPKRPTQDDNTTLQLKHKGGRINSGKWTLKEIELEVGNKNETKTTNNKTFSDLLKLKG